MHQCVRTILSQTNVSKSEILAMKVGEVGERQREREVESTY